MDHQRDKRKRYKKCPYYNRDFFYRNMDAYSFYLIRINRFVMQIVNCELDDWVEM